jgi:uncharacterized protein
MKHHKKDNIGAIPKQVKHYLEWSDIGKDGFFRYTIGAILVLITFLLLGGLGIIPISIIDPKYKDSLIGSNLALLSIFIIPFIGIPLITKWVHKRPYWSVALPVKRIEKWNLFTGFMVSTLVGVVTLLIIAAIGLMKLDYVGFNWGAFLPILIIGFVGIFIQASTEEMIFRGYLTQLVRRITKNPLFFIGIPALLFAAPHIPNISALGGGPLVLIPYLVSGLLFAWAAYRTGSLWMSVGLHWSNNLSGLVMFGVAGDALKTVAPVQFETPSLLLTTVFTVAQAVLTVGVIMFFLKRREAKVVEA